MVTLKPTETLTKLDNELSKINFMISSRSASKKYRIPYCQ